VKAGFIGLGAMGLPMARNLVKAGHELIVYNRTRSRAEALAGESVQVAASPPDACRAGIVLTMLADDPALESIAFAPGHLLDSLPPGGIHVSMGTISVELARQLAQAHSARSQSFVAAPVFGRPDAAEAQRLLVVAAGPSEAVERVRPLLEAVSRRLFVIGPDAAAASAVKLGGNFLIAAMLEALGEAFALVRKHGVDAAQFLEIANSLFQSPVYEGYGRIIVDRRFRPPGFPMRLGLKDARLILAAADAALVAMPLAGLVHDRLLAGVARGRGEADWSAFTELIAESAGLATTP
jgi:3-hydroxyisobutyrate dehydrogenase-like beta-hydroxyacid dehydrogenase